MPGIKVCPKCRAFIEAPPCPYCGTGDLPRPAPVAASDEAQRAHRFLFAVLVANVSIYLLMIALDPGRDVSSGSVRWLAPPSRDAIVLFGVGDAHLVREEGHWWRLVTACFLHLDLLHLILNCASTLALAPLAAAAFGLHRTVVLYVASGVAGAFASCLFEAGGAGASGALCGLIGALSVFALKLGGAEGRALFERTLLWIGLLVVWGMSANVSNAGHLGGLLAGAAISWLGAGSRVRGGRRERIWTSASLACLALVISVYALFQGPLVARIPERNRLRAFQTETGAILDAIEGRDGRGTLPRSVSAPPRGAEAVRDRVQAALDAARAGGDPAAAAAAAADARRLWILWSRRLLRTHSLFPD